MKNVDNKDMKIDHDNADGYHNAKQVYSPFKDDKHVEDDG